MLVISRSFGVALRSTIAMGLMLACWLGLGCSNTESASAEIPASMDVDALLDAPQSTSALVPTGTRVTCELIGLGKSGSVPFNFPGVDSAQIEKYVADSPIVLESALPAGQNSDVARVFAGDMGWPFEHEGATYFIFDDALFPPDSAYAPCPPNEPNCVSAALEDDMLARSAPSTSASDDCIQLQIPRAPGAEEFLPITVNGPPGEGGLSMGPGVVPGPGFSTGKFMFTLVPSPGTSCVSSSDCEAEHDVEGDTCIVPAGAANGHCYYGDCQPGTACGVRLNPSTLAVRSNDSSFITPRVGEHIESEAVLRAYRGHFATVAIHSRIDPQTSDGVVWVLGRNSFWGTPGLDTSPYLMFHPVKNGVLGEPHFFVGLIDGEPQYSPDQRDAVPVYSEDRPLPHHSSLAFVPDRAEGRWLLIYGGHAQVSLHDFIGSLVQPVVDSLFYDRSAGIVLRSAPQPWGPWTDAVTIWNPYTPGQGGYCEYMYFSDPDGKSGFSCPPELVGQNEQLNRWPNNGMGGEYGAAIVSQRTRTSDAGLTLYWLLSTWNPYRVIMLRTDLTIAP